MSSLQNINVPLIPDPRGVNIPIQAMQQELSTLPWMGYAYGQAFKIIKNVDNTRYTEPQVYAGNREWLSVEPNDSVSALSFFEVIEPKIKISENSIAWNQPVSLVVYVNLEIINNVEFTAKDWMFTDELIEEVTSLISSKKFGFIDETSYSVERRIENAFSEYSYWTSEERYIKRNYDAFKINFNVVYNDACII
jgi:hypothetical protein